MVGDKLAKAGLETDLVDVLRSQPDERAAKVFHHALLSPGNCASVVDEISAIWWGSRFDTGRKSSGRRQTLTELIMKIPREGPAFIFLHLKQARCESRPCCIGPG